MVERMKRNIEKYIMKELQDTDTESEMSVSEVESDTEIVFEEEVKNQYSFLESFKKQQKKISKKKILKKEEYIDD